MLERLDAFASDASATAIDAALLITRCLDETADIAAIEADLLALTRRHDPALAPWEFLRQEGFGSEPPRDVPAGSRLDELLAHRRGLPITLGALLVYLSDAAGREAFGINFPGHFLVSVQHQLIDPFSMTTRSRAECLAALPEDARSDELFVAADANTILLRMFNNLKYHYAGRAEFHRALDMLDFQLRVLPDNSSLRFEQGEFWLRLGSVQGARAAFEQVATAADAELRELAARRLETLSDRSDTLH